MIKEYSNKFKENLHLFIELLKFAEPVNNDKEKKSQTKT